MLALFGDESTFLILLSTSDVVLQPGASCQKPTLSCFGHCLKGRRCSFREGSTKLSRAMSPGTLINFLVSKPAKAAMVALPGPVFPLSFEALTLGEQYLLPRVFRTGSSEE